MQEKISMDAAHDFEAKMPLSRKIPLGLQHVFAMFVGNLTPLLIITGACGLAGGEFARPAASRLLQNAMLVAGIVTLVQLFSIGPVGGKVPIIMGTSSGFIGVFNSGCGFDGRRCAGVWRDHGCVHNRRPVRDGAGLFPQAAAQILSGGRYRHGCAVASVCRLISVGINSFGGGNTAKDFGSVENLLLAVFVLVVILVFKHWQQGLFELFRDPVSALSAGYIAAFIMGFVLPTTGVDADGVEYTKAWVLNWNKVARGQLVCNPEADAGKAGV